MNQNKLKASESFIKIVITVIVIAFAIYFFGKAVGETFYHATH